MSELTLFTAAQLAAMIREHRVSAVEVLEAHLAHIAKHNPRLNAIVTLDEAKAHERARQADAALARGESWSALHGVPVTIKDAFETAGLRTTSGYKPWSNYVPQNDAPAVARLRQAGAIILGKTNLPALAAGSQTVNDVFGRTNNPWSVAYTPGGSTGGGAAAVAVGLSPLELGSDISGSIRAPAHFCGIFGLKPTSGRISVLGHRSSAQPLRLPQEWRGLLQLPVAGPLARSVADLRLALTVLADPGTPALEPAPPKPLRDLRIAWTDEMSILPISADTRAAIQTLACKLSDASATVARHTAPNIDYAEAWELAAEALATINTLMQPSLMRALAAHLFIIRRQRVGGVARVRQLEFATQPRPQLIRRGECLQAAFLPGDEIMLDNALAIRRIRKLDSQHLAVPDRLLQAIGGQLVLGLGLDDGHRIVSLEVQDIVGLAALLVRMLAPERHNPAWRNHSLLGDEVVRPAGGVQFGDNVGSTGICFGHGSDAPMNYEANCSSSGEIGIGQYSLRSK
jgi:Asp-tRNA(Asn)/Glu-tRNA(Gln) amidotransferase A subunit family amidase